MATSTNANLFTEIRQNLLPTSFSLILAAKSRGFPRQRYWSVVPGESWRAGPVTSHDPPGGCQTRFERTPRLGMYVQFRTCVYYQ